MYDVPKAAASPSEPGFYPSLDRFSAFSDGVFAIAITLLVLELSVPSPAVPLLPALLEEWPDFLGYLISSAFIGGIWLTHSGLTRLMKRGDTVVNGANLLLLLLVALLPFTTSVMVTHLSGPDIGASDRLTPVSDDYEPADSAFNGQIKWIQIDLGKDADDADCQITPEERYRLLVALQ